MNRWVGTSGFSYKEWKGTFYPEDLPDKKMLEHYGRQLPCVEINNTFYRLPRESVLESWAGQVPPEFRFVLKASRRITHLKRLKGAEDETEYLLRTAGVLGSRLGAILFQLPGNLKKDVPRLAAFLDLLPSALHAVFEFRHASWLAEDVVELLTACGCALCVVDGEAGLGVRRRTAPFGYLRLRQPSYTDAELDEWLAWMVEQNWTDVYVFFKHEEAGAGPALARRFLDR